MKQTNTNANTGIKITNTTKTKETLKSLDLHANRSNSGQCWGIFFFNKIYICSSQFVIVFFFCLFLLTVFAMRPSACLGAYEHVWHSLQKLLNTRQVFISQSSSLLLSPNMAELPLPHFCGMRWNICLLSLYTEAAKWSFPYWWQAITHTLTSCILENAEGALSLSLLMPSSLHCCFFYWTICDDARAHTLNYIFVTLKRFLLNGNSWHRTDRGSQPVNTATYVCDLQHAWPWIAQPLLRHLCVFLLNENTSIITAENLMGAAGANQCV